LENNSSKCNELNQINTDRGEEKLDGACLSTQGSGSCLIEMVKNITHETNWFPGPSNVN